MEDTSNWRRRTIQFFISQCVTLFGSQITQFAIVWYVTLQTDSGGWIAAFSLCSYLPQFFISFPGGVWADRYDRKKLIICADLSIAAVTLAMILMMPHITSESGLLTALLFMSALRSAGAGIQTPAVNAVIPQLVPEKHLMRYNGINASMQSFVQFAAPAAAAAVLTFSSLRIALLTDIVTAAAGIGLFLCVLLTGQEVPRKTGSILSDMSIGIRYGYSDVTIRKTLLLYGFFLFLTVPAGYLAGLFVSRVYGDTCWFLTVTELAGFGGMTAGGLLMSFRGSFRNHRFVLAAGLALFGIMSAAMGVSHNFAVYLIFMALYGIGLTMVQTAVTTILQESAPSDMQGRVMGLMSAIYACCYPAGMAFFGPMADVVPLRQIMIISGVLLLAIAFCSRR